jgi:hypothetical protein
MSPQFAVALAARWCAHRIMFLVFAVCAFIVLVAVVFLTSSAHASKCAFAAFGPLVFLPWSLLCLCSWFGPGARLNTFPVIVRWYASLFLTAFFVGSISWPLFVFFG